MEPQDLSSEDLSTETNTSSPKLMHLYQGYRLSEEVLTIINKYDLYASQKMNVTTAFLNSELGTEEIYMKILTS